MTTTNNINTFPNIEGTITPLQVGTSVDEYSVKLITNPVGSDTQVNVYAGTFFSDIFTNAIGMQATLITAIEVAIQQMFEESFIMGTLPSLGKPSGFVFQGDDILVSFSKKNDYFVFNGTGVTREVKFISVGQPDVSYLPGSGGAPATYVFDSPEHDLTYEVSYPSTGVFTITDSRARIVDFDSTIPSPGVIALYRGVALDETIHVSDGTQTYKSSPYTDVGITIMPSTLPPDPNDIIVAEGQTGFFYNENVVTTFQDLVDYIFLQYPTFTVRQKSYITRFVKNIFNISRNSIYYILKINNRNSFSINNGYASYASTCGISMEMKLT